MNVAIVHDYLVQYGGAERVLEALHGLWPEAPVYTSMYAPEAMPESFADMDVRTTFLQRLPLVRRRFKAALPLYPMAMRSIDLADYHVVVSSSSGWAHGVVPHPEARHLVYCHTPARWLYRTDSYIRAERLAAAPFLPALRRWDRKSAARPTEYLANSAAVRERIARVYGRPARVVHPPVETGRFSIVEPEDYYLCVARLTPYKRIDLAVQACERLGRRLVVAGEGPARRDLMRLAGGRTTFLGRVPDADLTSLVERCRALIVPAEEDFCIAAVEAMAAGRPVVGYARGGLLETVIPERTGVLFADPTPESLAAALCRLERLELVPEAIRAHALRFGVERFHAELLEIVGEPLERGPHEQCRRTGGPRERAWQPLEHDVGVAARQ